MINDESQGQLLEILNQYAGHLDTLVKLLEEENNYLRQRDITGIEKCTQNKQTLLEKLEYLEQERNRLCQFSNINIQDNSQDIVLKDVNTRIKSLLDKCNHLNELNGAIIEISGQFSQRLLGIMFGETFSDNLYDANGKNSTQTPAQTLVRI